jgi:hypothetical protein
MVLAVRNGISLALAESPGLDMMRLHRSLEELFELAPDREPEADPEP